MKLMIEIEMENAAFDEDPREELAAVLKRMLNSLRLYDGYEEVILRGTNGNTVGQAVLGNKPRKKT